MSDFLEQAAAELNSKLTDGGFDGSAKFAIADVGAIVLDGSGARVSDDDTDVTLSADADKPGSLIVFTANAAGCHSVGHTGPERWSRQEDGTPELPDFLR